MFFMGNGLEEMEFSTTRPMGAVRGNLVHNGLQLAARSDYEYEGLSGSG